MPNRRNQRATGQPIFHTNMTTITSTLVNAASSPESSFSCAACNHRGHRPTPIMLAAASLPFDLVQCPDCRLVQQSPRYTPAQLSRLYRGDYYVFEESDSHRWARAVQQYVLHLRGLERPSGPRLLDIGCATGHLGAIATARGWRYTGIDVSAEAVSRASVQFGLDVRAGALAQHIGTLHPSDVVFLGDVIEHVLEPRALLDEVRKTLTPGGVVCIDTPNWSGRWRRVFRRRWLGLNRYHINLFEADSLRKLLEGSGFAVEGCGSYTNYRYEPWSMRPEVQRWLGMLPRFIAWRIGRLLDDFTDHTPWAMLRTHPPMGVEHAVREVSITAAQIDPRRMASNTGDNLFVTARRT